MARRVTLPVTLVTLCLLAACVSPSYTYYGIVLDKSPGTVLAARLGTPDQCKALFEPPGVYVGPWIDIPEDAAGFGTLIVTRQGELKALALYTWRDEAEGNAYGCNGPAPQCAHQARTHEELMTSITKIFGKDADTE